MTDLIYMAIYAQQKRTQEILEELNGATGEHREELIKKYLYSLKSAENLITELTNTDNF